MWRAALLELRLFREVYEYAHGREDHSVDRDRVLETIVLRVPHENLDRQFKTFVRWARYGKLFDYHEEEGRLVARDPAAG